MKATHNMGIVSGGDVWELHDSANGLYFRLAYQGGGGGIWCKSITTLDKYLSDTRFVIAKINTFKGNK